MKRVRPGLIAVLALLFWAAQGHALTSSAALSGVVRDVHGTPQMGAMVELLTGDATSVATAFTDTRGRYLMPSVSPGKYQLRASAAFFVPVTRSNLSLHAGAQAIINLTMSTLFEAGNWLPAERRGPEELNDDWKWTLRSSANRPLLRLVDPETGLSVSTSASETHHASTQGRVTVVNGDGAFAFGGTHQVVTLDRVAEDGSGAIFRADLGDPQAPLAIAPSADILAGFQHQMLNGRMRMVASFATHPELVAGGAAGFETLRMATAQELTLGDAVLIDAGTLFEAEKLVTQRVVNEPFVRVTVHPGEHTAVQYRYATGRQLQSSADLDSLKPRALVLAATGGRPLSNKGSHHEFSVSQKVAEKDVITVAVFRDSFANGALMGSGSLDLESRQALAVVADPTTATFRMATAGYTGRGARAGWTHEVAPGLNTFAEYEVGTALRASGPGTAAKMLKTRGHTASAATAGLRGHITRTGTTVNAEYRWQPVSTLTQVDAFHVGMNEAYLGFSLRQRVWGGRFLPHGMDAVIEATNLLEQGYQPVVAPDGHTLFLAQVPRAIQGGLAFNF